MQVHAEMVYKNRHSIQLVMMLGDDLAIVSKAKINTKNLRKDTEINFNMQSKEMHFKTHATFCSMIIHNNSCGLGYGPDLIKLNFRYDVTNGSHSDDANILLRAMSYTYKLGDIPESRLIISKLNMPIRPIKYYEQHALMAAVSDKYNMSVDQVEGYLHQLVDKMINNQSRVVNFLAFGNKPKY
jgi:hypothetical protein